MKKIHNVTVNSGWILQKIAERIAVHNNNPEYEFTVGHEPDLEADVNFYIDLENCYRGVKTKCDIAYFSHADQHSDDICKSVMTRLNGYQLDGIVHMNKRYEEMLVRVGYPAEKMTTIVPGQVVDRFPPKKITFGIVSRGGYPGYGDKFMSDLLHYITHHAVSGVHNWVRFAFLGSGWDHVVQYGRLIGLEIYDLPSEDYDLYPEFYNHIDYLLIPGLWTAGPMCFQEALACGVPVVAADIGFAGYEFQPDYMFPPNDIEALSNIIITIISPAIARRGQVEDLSWASYTTQFVEFVQGLKDDRSNQRQHNAV